MKAIYMLPETNTETASDSDTQHLKYEPPIKMLTPKELADIFCISYCHTLNLLHQDKLPHVHVGKTFRTPLSMLENWMEEQKKHIEREEENRWSVSV